MGINRLGDDRLGRCGLHNSTTVPRQVHMLTAFSKQSLSDRVNAPLVSAHTLSSI